MFKHSFQTASCVVDALAGTWCSSANSHVAIYFLISARLVAPANAIMLVGGSPASNGRMGLCRLVLTVITHTSMSSNLSNNRTPESIHVLHLCTNCVSFAEFLRTGDDHRISWRKGSQMPDQTKKFISNL